MYYNKILGGIVGDIVGSTRERKERRFRIVPYGQPIH